MSQKPDQGQGSKLFTGMKPPVGFGNFKTEKKSLELPDMPSLGMPPNAQKTKANASSVLQENSGNAKAKLFSNVMGRTLCNNMTGGRFSTRPKTVAPSGQHSTAAVPKAVVVKEEESDGWSDDIDDTAFFPAWKKMMKQEKSDGRLAASSSSLRAGGRSGKTTPPGPRAGGRPGKTTPPSPRAAGRPEKTAPPNQYQAREPPRLPPLPEYFGLPSDVGANIFLQLLSGLRFLHCEQVNVVHRDLKPDNLLIDKDATLKIADFGWCCKLTNEAEDGPYAQTQVCGTPEYMAPEVVKGEVNRLHGGEPFGDPQVGGAVDIWGAGCVLYQLRFGKTPFDNHFSHQAPFSAAVGGPPAPTVDWEGYLQAMLNEDYRFPEIVAQPQPNSIVGKGDEGQVHEEGGHDEREPVLFEDTVRWCLQPKLEKRAPSVINLTQKSSWCGLHMDKNVGMGGFCHQLFIGAVFIGGRGMQG
eukprot:g6553.t1